MIRIKSCRACGAQLTHTFANLGVAPLSNAFVSLEQAELGEAFYPLHAYVCNYCFLVQLAEFEQPENIFHDDYVYFSSFSQSWLNHAKNYCEAMVERFSLRADAHIAEVASNDGYLLKNFLKYGMKLTGIEPSSNCAKAAINIGIHTEIEFFNAASACRIRQNRGASDLIVANNVLAHVPDIHDFVSGFRELMCPEGITTFEFPHLMRLIEFNQFDTIYHEHFSYLALGPLQEIFSRKGLRVFDVEELTTHGGSLRVFVCNEGAAYSKCDAVEKVLTQEKEAGLYDIATYQRFGDGIVAIKEAVISFLIEARRSGKSVVAYGAAAKGNTLINYCGLGTNYIAFVVDRNPIKQNRLMPGSRIPVYDVSTINEFKPDYLLILPWNLRDEIVEQMSEIRKWGGQFVTAIPQLEVF